MVFLNIHQTKMYVYVNLLIYNTNTIYVIHRKDMLGELAENIPMILFDVSIF